MPIRDPLCDDHRIHAFMDVDELVPGGHFTDEITLAIRSSSNVAVFYEKPSLTDYLNTEVGSAQLQEQILHENGSEIGFLSPVLLPGMDSEKVELHPAMRERGWIDSHCSISMFSSSS